MFFELITVVSVAFAACGVALIFTKLLRLKPHKSFFPLLAALSMISYTMWSRYTWADRIISNLPAESAVIETYADEGLLEPWTMLFPRVGGLLVLDRKATLRHPEHPDIAMVSLELMEQYEETLQLRQFVDCTRRRRAPVVPGVAQEAGLPPEGLWSADGQPYKLFDLACR